MAQVCPPSHFDEERYIACAEPSAHGRQTPGTGVLANGRFFDTTTTSSDRSGWVVGVGVEWGFAPGWSAKIEYNHIDLGSTDITVLSSLGTTSFVSSTETIDLVKAGVNYRFNWGGPVVARY
jgi:outer membrane immunogenic protein